MGGGSENKRCLHGLRERARVRNRVALLVHAQARKDVKLGSNEERDKHLVEAARLPIPLLDALQRRAPRQVEHEQDRRAVRTHKRDHLVELVFAATEVEDGERDRALAQRDDLLHEVDAQRLDVVLLELVLHVLDHERRLANVRVAEHTHFELQVGRPFRPRHAPRRRRRAGRRAVPAVPRWRAGAVLAGGQPTRRHGCKLAEARGALVRAQRADRGK